MRMMAEKLTVQISSVHSIVSDDLLLGKVCSKLVPKCLYGQQKETHVSICQATGMYEDEPNFLDNVIAS